MNCRITKDAGFDHLMEEFSTGNKKSSSYEQDLT